MSPIMTGHGTWTLRIAISASDARVSNCLTRPGSTTTNAGKKLRMSRYDEVRPDPVGFEIRVRRSVGHALNRIALIRSRKRGFIAALAGTVAMVSCWGADWESSKNRFNLNTHIGFNIEASFDRLGAVDSSNVGSDLRGTDHFYDDGYNRVDANGNAGGQTRFWGYSNAGQVVDDSIVMSSYSSSAGGRIDDVRDAPHWGAELTYARQVGWNGSYWWGVEIGLSWTDLSFKEQSRFQGDATLLRDAYALNGTVPPASP